MLINFGRLQSGWLGVTLVALLGLVGCGTVKGDPQAEAPPPAQVVPGPNAALITVEHPEQYPLATASAYTTVGTMAVTGTVNPDVARMVPVVTLASGKVVTPYKRISCCSPSGATMFLAVFLTIGRR